MSDAPPAAVPVPVPATPPAAPTKASTEGIQAQIDLTKLMIALSTGAVAFTVTFLDKFQSRADNAALSASAWLFGSWLSFGATILMALLTLMALAGTLDAIDRVANNWTYDKDQEAAASGQTGHVLWSARLMLLFFVIGVGLMIMAGVRRN